MTIEVEIDSLECANCGCATDENDSMTSTDSNEIVCLDCGFCCDYCGDIFTNDDDTSEVDDNYRWCESCISNHANYCDGHEGYHTNGSFEAQDRSGYYCEHCINDAYYCEECDEYNFDGCDRCSQREADAERVIHDYNYRPDPIFYSTDASERLYFGMEIEVEAPRGDWDKRIEASQYAYNELENNEIAYLKSDGSLNCGFEIVTHPMSHDFFKNGQDVFWNTIEHLRTEIGMRSWSTSTCGLHIHISRTGFSGGAHMHRFLSLIYSNERLYSALAGRASSRWAKFTDADMPAQYEGTIRSNGQYNTKLIPAYRSFKEKINNGRHSERYSAVNMQNLHTLELRIFRGSLKGSNVRAALDLAHASVEYTRHLTVRQVRDKALYPDAFIEYIKAHQDIYQDLNTRISQVLIEDDPLEQDE